MPLEAFKAKAEMPPARAYCQCLSHVYTLGPEVGIIYILGALGIKYVRPSKPQDQAFPSVSATIMKGDGWRVGTRKGGCSSMQKSAAPRRDHT